MARTIFVTLVFAAAFIPGAWTQEPEAVEGSDVIIVCPIDGMIDRGVAVVVERAVEEARVREAAAIVFVVDTPGGLVDAAIDISESILGAPCKTIAYIKGMGAISAGALISYGCNVIVMTNSTNMGATTPVIPSSEGMKKTSEKTVSFVRAKMRALADAQGHNADIAEAMVDEDIELRAILEKDGSYRVYGIAHGAADETPKTVPATRPSIVDTIKKLVPGDIPSPFDSETVPGGAQDGATEVPAEQPEPGTAVYEDGSELVLAKGKLLTLTPQEALKFGVIKFTAQSLDEALTELGYVDTVKIEIVPNWAEKVFRFLTSPTIAGLLLLLGVGGLYLEVRTPGFGLPGLVGITCLALLFGAHYVLDMAEWGDLLLLVVGFALIMAEIFIFPGFGLAGVGGALCLLVGLYLTFTNFTIPQYTWEFERLTEVIYSFTLALTTFLVLTVLAWKFVPNSSLANHFLVLSSSQDVAEGYTVQTQTDMDAAMGLRGVAASLLRPTGKGRFDDKTYQVVSRGEYIKKGTPIVIIHAEGNRYVVDKADGEEETG